VRKICDPPRGAANDIVSAAKMDLAAENDTAWNLSLQMPTAVASSFGSRADNERRFY
jgi:hypothetical protein